MSGAAGVVLLVLVVVGGSLADLVVGGATGMTLGFLAGCVVAALLTTREGLRAVAVAPPLVFLFVLVGQSLVDGTTDVKALAVAVGTELVVQFPVLAAGTGAAVLIAVVRAVAEPPPARHRP